MSLSDDDRRRIEAEERYRAEVRAREQAAAAPPKKRGLISRVIRFFVFSFIALVVIFIGLVIITVAVGSKETKSASSAGTTTAAPEPREYADISCVDFSRLFGLASKASEVQKEEMFKLYEGKYVRWSGTVSEVSTFLGSLKLQVKCLPETFSSDAIVSVNDDEREKLLKFVKNSKVKFEARLDRWGALTGHSLSDGTIVQ